MSEAPRGSLVEVVFYIEIGGGGDLDRGTNSVPSFGEREHALSLAREIQNYVKTRLAAHEYPREVAFVDALPMTTTGKIIRREMRDRAIAETAT